MKGFMDSAEHSNSLGNMVTSHGFFMVSIQREYPPVFDNGASLLFESYTRMISPSFNTEKSLRCLNFQDALKIDGNIDCIGGG